MNVRNWLVRLYPSAWRGRYGEEFEALLAECLHSPLDVVDIFFGALDAHLGFTHETNWRYLNMVNKLRTTILIVFAAYIGFVIGGLSLYGLVDDSPAAKLMKTDTALSAAWTTIEAASVIALLAVVAGGLPLAVTVIRRALTSSRRDLRLLLVPVFAFLALVLYGFFLASVANGWLQIPGVIRSVAPDNFPIGNRLLIGGFILVFVLGAIASTAAVWKVIANTDIEESTVQALGQTASIKLYQYAFVPAVITALGMFVMLAGTLVFGWMAHSTLPDWFATNQGLLLTNTSLSYGTTVTIMVLSTAAALFGLVRGRSARKAA
jgi:MFS family permease